MSTVTILSHTLSSPFPYTHALSQVIDGGDKTDDFFFFFWGGGEVNQCGYTCRSVLFTHPT